MTKRKRFIIWTGVFCALVWGLLIGLSNYLGSSNFGKAVITLSDGSKVFVIHEQWGLHDERLSVTQNPDGCSPSNPDTDYIDQYGDGENLIYSVEKDGLVLYDDEYQTEEVKIHEPSKPWSSPKVIVKKARYSAFDNPQVAGVRVLKVPVNQKCWINFFRKSRTSFGASGQ